MSVSPYETPDPLPAGERAAPGPPVTPTVDASLETLVSGLSHVVNNQLTALLGNLELAALGLEAESVEARRLDEAESAARRIVAVMRSLSTAVGAHWPRTAIASAGELVARVCDRIGAETPGLDGIRLEVAPGVPDILCDPEQIGRVVEMLLHNAIEASAATGSPIAVRVGTTSVRPGLRLVSAGSPLPSGGYVFVEVMDHGIGMDRATLERAFDPYFSTKFTGRGLSLAVALGIVRAHGGGIVAQSEPGAGTTMRVLLPV